MPKARVGTLVFHGSADPPSQKRLTALNLTKGGESANGAGGESANGAGGESANGAGGESANGAGGESANRRT